MSGLRWLLLGGLAAAQTGSPTPPPEVAWAWSQPVQAQGGDDARVCWTLQGDPRRVDGFRLLSGPAGARVSSLDLVVDLPSAERCWTGPARAGVYAVAPLRQGGEGPRVLAEALPFRVQPRVPAAAGLASDTARVLVESAGQLYIGTDGAGLSAVAPAGRAWFAWGADQIGSAVVHAAVSAPDGSLWLGTGAGVVHFSAAEIRVYGASEGLPSGAVYTLAWDARGRLLAGGERGSVARLDAAADTFRTLLAPLGDQDGHLLGVDAAGNLWFELQGQVRRYRDGWTPPLRRDLVRAFAIDLDHNVWLGTATSGLVRYDPRTDTFRAWGQASGAPSDEVLSVFPDADGGVWVGTPTGIGHFRPTDQAWDAPQDPPSGEVAEALAVLDGLAVLAVFRDQGGALWFSAGHQGVYQREPSGAWRVHQPASLQRAPVRQVALGGDGEVWFLGQGGLSRLQPATLTWRWWRSAGSVQGPLSTLHTTPTGEVWVGGRGGLARWRRDPERWASLPLPSSDAQVTALLLGGDAGLVGTDHGLYALDAATGEVVAESWLSRFDGEAITTLYRDQSEALWVGTPRGLWRRERGSTTWEEGGNLGLGQLAGASITSVLEDGTGAIWVGTRDRGALRYQPASDRLVGDILPVTSVEGMALHAGQLWFATSEGILSLNPALYGGRPTPVDHIPAAQGVVVDAAGVLWAATRSGATRWDTTSKGVPRVLAAAVGEPEGDRYARLLAPDADGAMWAATAAGNLVRYGQDGVERARLTPGDGLPDAPLRSLARLPEGALLLGSDGDGVSALRGGDLAQDQDEGPGATITALAEGCAATERGVACAGPDGRWEAVELPAGLSDAIAHLAWAGRENLWLASDQQLGLVTQRDARPIGLPQLRGAAGDQISALVGDPSGAAWVGLARGGLLRVALTDGRVSIQALTPPATVGDLEVRSVALDLSGQLWIATNTGLWEAVRPTRQPGAALSLEWSEVDLGSADPAARDVRAVSVASDGAVWAATGAGTFRVDPTQGQATLATPPPDPTPPLLGGSELAVALRGASAALVGQRLVGAPSSPDPITEAAEGCGARAWLLRSGLTLITTGEALEVVDPPVRAPETVALRCLSDGSPELCVGGQDVACRRGDRWRLGTARDSAVTAMLAVGTRLWLGDGTGQVCVSEDVSPTTCLDVGRGAITTLAADGAGGVWLGAARGSAHVRPGPPLTLDSTNTVSTADLSAARSQGAAPEEAAISSVVAVPEGGVVWLASALGATRVRLRGGVLGDQAPESTALGMPPVPPAAGGAPPAVTGLRLAATSSALVLRRGDELSDLPLRPSSRPPWLWVSLGLGVGTLVLGGLWAGVVYSPTVRTWRRDPSSVERVPLAEAAPAIRLLRLYAPGFARATIGARRLRALERLSRTLDGDPEDLLPLTATVLDLEAAGPAERGTLPVKLGQLGLALKRPDTLLVALPEGRDPEGALREALGARAFHELVPPLVLHLRADPPVIAGAVVLSEADLRSVAWSREPRRRLASLLWQRSDLQGLSPYQAHGAVQDPRMFFGRDAELRDLTAANIRRALLVIGPRKVGKTSVLLRAQAELERRGNKAIYVTLRATIAGPYDLTLALARATRLPQPERLPDDADLATQAMVLGAWIRAHLTGATLLLDEADAFLRLDRQQGGAASEELRALVQEGICALALAGYGTLYRAALSQSETAYNLGAPLFLGPLDPAAALRLATEPMERMGIRWSAPELPQRLTEAVGNLPHLIQEACRRLLVRVRGFREPVLNHNDLQAVLGDWRPTGEPNSLRELLIANVETNLKGPAQAAVWLLAGETETSFSVAELDQTLRGAGLGLDGAGVLDVGLALQVSGTCTRVADRYRFLVPLLGTCVASLDIAWRVTSLRDAWRALSEEQRAAFRFWGD